MARRAPTHAESDDLSLEIYLREIRRRPLLTKEQEVELARRIKKGDELALHELVQSNLRFVVSVARNYTGRGLSLADLINEGNVGLIKAAERFDETRNFRFISYAIWWIRQAILQALSEQTRVVRIPVNRAGRASRIIRTAQGLEQTLERGPTDEEIADQMNREAEEKHGKKAAQKMKLDEAAVREYRSYAVRPVSLDAPAGESGDTSLGSLLEDEGVASPDRRVVERDLARDLRAALRTLDGRERKILSDYFGMETGEGVTLEAIGKDLGLTRERVRQLKERAMRKILQRNDQEKLRSYLK